ncbi:MAG: glycosyltransferase family 2 protein [Candidatus Yanofskybacteria bacterium]|nr:glycosyltransferase family 2 protein [Candidatus Yanofskybacteria bacterium]
MPNPKISINLVIYNGEKYIRQCLDAVFAQSYPHEFIELNILDNNSADGTKNIINDSRSQVLDSRFSKFNFVQSKLNLGMWPGQEKLFEQSHGKYIIALSVDVVLDKDFIKNTVEIMEHDEKIGALQAKIYKYDFPYIQNTKYEILDTLGFKIFRSRRIINIGHGEIDCGQYDQKQEIFAVEGAVPIFRRQALEDCRLESQGQRIVEPNFFWYGDDLDLAWRIRLFGWKQVYAPRVIAWHDRKTTKALAGGWREFIKIRKTVPMFKRRLDWRNTTLTVVKNDFTVNLLQDMPYFLWRQLQLWIYFILFEPAMILEIFKVAKLLPRMLKRRREIMRKAKILPREFRQWII